MARYRVILSGLCLLVAVQVFAGPADDLRRRLMGGTHESLSGQFVIHDPPVTDNYPLRLAGNPATMVQLDPALLSVSCERIKKSLLSCLNTPDRWHGKIFIFLHHAQDLNEEIVVTPTLIGNTWNYYLELPDLIERSRLVAGVAEVVLLEMSNREADHSTQMPVWLVQGLSQEILSFATADLVLSPPRSSENGINISRANRVTQPNEDLERLRLRLRASPPLTIEQLSFPPPGQFSGGGADVYRDSAQLFVHQLLRLKDGHPAMLALLKELPAHLNWQLAFLRAFNADFSSQRDLEKWWDLSISEFCGRTLSQAWSSEETWNRLDDAIHQDVEIRTGTRDLPLHSQLSLQKVVVEWEASDRDAVLQQKLRELLLLQMRSSPDLTGLVAGYRQTLYNYIHRRDGKYNALTRKDEVRENPEDVIQHLIIQLDALDIRRMESRPQKQASASGDLQTGSNR